LWYKSGYVLKNGVYVPEESGNDEAAECVGQDISVIIASTWKNNEQNIYQFNGDIIANLPETSELTDYTVILVEFQNPVEDIDVWDADASAIDVEQKYWIFAPKYRDKFITLGGQMWKFNFMGKTQRENVAGQASLCDKYPLHGQFGEKSEDQKTIDYLSNIERDPYDGSLCKLPHSGKYPKNPKNPEPKWVSADKKELNKTKNYDLNEVLTKSILFYEAQRAGPLDETNRSWG